MLRPATAVDRLIEASRGYRFRGKFRLLDPFVPHDGEKRASVFGYEMSLDLSLKVQRDVYIGNYERTETRPGLLFRETGNDRAGHRREHRLLHRARCADGGSGWPSIRGRALPTQFYRDLMAGFGTTMSARSGHLTSPWAPHPERRKCSPRSRTRARRLWSSTTNPALRRLKFEPSIRVSMNGNWIESIFLNSMSMDPKQPCWRALATRWPPTR